MSDFKVLALFGKSGAGKDTLQNWIVKFFANTNKIISYTSRPKRDYEVDGEDYFFISKDEFGKKLVQGGMLEASYFNDWFYGTALDSLKEDTINVGVFNITGIKHLLKDERIKTCPLLITAPDATRLIRSLSREENPDCKEICRRFFTDEEDFTDIPFSYLQYSNAQKSGMTFVDIIWPQINELLDSDD